MISILQSVALCCRIQYQCTGQDSMPSDFSHLLAKLSFVNCRRVRIKSCFYIWINSGFRIARDLAVLLYNIQEVSFWTEACISYNVLWWALLSCHQLLSFVAVMSCILADCSQTKTSRIRFKKLVQLGKVWVCCDAVMLLTCCVLQLYCLVCNFTCECMCLCHR